VIPVPEDLVNTVSMVLASQSRELLQNIRDREIPLVAVSGAIQKITYGTYFASLAMSLRRSFAGNVLIESDLGDGEGLSELPPSHKN
jgi:hypothetical protein